MVISEFGSLDVDSGNGASSVVETLENGYHMFENATIFRSVTGKGPYDGGMHDDGGMGLWECVTGKGWL